MQRKAEGGEPKLAGFSAHCPAFARGEGSLNDAVTPIITEFQPRTAATFSGFEMSAVAKSVRFDDASMWVQLSDGRTLGVPLAWFPRLFDASPEHREAVEVAGEGLHWAALDEDISVAGLLAGRGDQTVSGRRERKRTQSAADKTVRKSA